MTEGRPRPGQPPPGTGPWSPRLLATGSGSCQDHRRGGRHTRGAPSPQTTGPRPPWIPGPGRATRPIPARLLPGFTAFFKTSFWLRGLRPLTMGSLQGDGLSPLTSRLPPMCRRPAWGARSKLQPRGPHPRASRGTTQESALRSLCSGSLVHTGDRPPQSPDPVNLTFPSHTCSPTPPFPGALPRLRPAQASCSHHPCPPLSPASTGLSALRLAESNGVPSPPWGTVAGGLVEDAMDSRRRRRNLFLLGSGWGGGDSGMGCKRRPRVCSTPDCLWRCGDPCPGSCTLAWHTSRFRDLGLSSRQARKRTGLHAPALSSVVFMRDGGCLGSDAKLSSASAPAAPSVGTMTPLPAPATQVIEGPGTVAALAGLTLYSQQPAGAGGGS